MSAATILEVAQAAAQLGVAETLAGPAALPPGELAVVAVAAAWIGWVDRRHGVIPDLALGLLAGLAAARLAPLGAGTLAGAVAVGAAVLAALSLLGWLAARVGVAPLGAGDVRLLAAVTVLLGLPGLTVTLALGGALLAIDGVRRVQAVGRPLTDALMLPIRMGPHLALGLMGAATAAAMRW